MLRLSVLVERHIIVSFNTFTLFHTKKEEIVMQRKNTSQYILLTRFCMLVVGLLTACGNSTSNPGSPTTPNGTPQATPTKAGYSIIVPIPSTTVTPTPTSAATVTPTAVPTTAPTAAPTVAPTTAPTPAPANTGSGSSNSLLLWLLGAIALVAILTLLVYISRQGSSTRRPPLGT